MCTTSKALNPAQMLPGGNNKYINPTSMVTSSSNSVINPASSWLNDKGPATAGTLLTGPSQAGLRTSTGGTTLLGA